MCDFGLKNEASSVVNDLIVFWEAELVAQGSQHCINQIIRSQTSIGLPTPDLLQNIMLDALQPPNQLSRHVLLLIPQVVVRKNIIINHHNMIVVQLGRYRDILLLSAQLFVTARTDLMVEVKQIAIVLLLYEHVVVVGTRVMMARRLFLVLLLDFYHLVVGIVISLWLSLYYRLEGLLSLSLLHVQFIVQFVFSVKTTDRYVIPPAELLDVCLLHLLPQLAEHNCSCCLPCAFGILLAALYPLNPSPEHFHLFLALNLVVLFIKLSDKSIDLSLQFQFFLVLAVGGVCSGHEYDFLLQLMIDSIACQAVVLCAYVVEEIVVATLALVNHYLLYTNMIIIFYGIDVWNKTIHF